MAVPTQLVAQQAKGGAQTGKEVKLPEAVKPPVAPPVVPPVAPPVTPPATLAPAQPTATEPAKEAAPTAKTEEPGKEIPTAPKTEEEKVYLNVQEQDIKEVIKQISKATGRNFIIDSKVSGKITILSNKMMTKDQAYQAFLSALEATGFTVVEGPAGILKVIPLKDAKNFPIPTHIDTTPYTDTYITRLIKLENISANDMAEALKGLISRNGDLFAYPETNTMVITDSGSNIDRLMKIIKELDQEGPQEVVEIIPIHYANAKELAGMVLSLFEQEQKQGNRAGQPQEVAKVSKIIADERTNSIIVLASKRAIDKVKELINQLDAKLEEGSEGKIHVHYLRYAKAKDIATVLQGLSSAAAKPAGAGQAGGTTVAELDEFKVASDDATNSLLITATAKTYKTLVEKVLDQLDIPRKQVYLEAMVLEFLLSKQLTAGISAHGGLIKGPTLSFGQTFNSLRGLVNPLAAGGSSPLLNSPGIVGGILSRRTVDVRTINDKGESQTVSMPAASAFVTALSSVGDTNLIASPNLLALDNEESTIEIIRKEPEPGQTTISATGLQQLGTPSRIEAGLKLVLTPQITQDGNVRLKIDEQFSFFATPQNANLGTQAIQERKVKTSVVTSDGQTVVIGGLMQDEIRSTKSKIPILGDIPLLGLLFRNTQSSKNKSNLILFITPHIIRDSSDFNKVLRRKMGQNEDFLAGSYKKRQKSQIEATIKGHNAELFDMLEGVPPPAGESAAPEPEQPEEPRLVIDIPASKEMEKEMKKNKNKNKKQKSAETPVITAPPASTRPPVTTGTPDETPTP